ncbi:hypothetical protein CcaverHIS002_0509270 [Cutaneotrichosporon cavernicola]|uniref:Uncharacterized protein n=1 Tax=Cutaneotrichosporon cavernicola TaxID=279322 RepID=A0AA48L7I2_9TREE|nr:uncharacterized protein CcaverHIS019_0509830 [Cutaneotrichosporon cavernicola]BEI85526.1 hypothetical protein CcaverHIS002_0509270 [Cutaneotrichosporon cavernicola]BEI93355.1 hypothetical protein CcaverHIS019_0509830 [Cutaneotrichosporon cavernicola]BEJ01134.1 hypothetical protein CcaverHIS631_0509910 [Cutaneotrichosporon cavernicola]BEJ08902.1 hypothetical protein CcaverHIS641_0509960 [Cutaneotrichosporon cavernicola]
MFIPLAAPLMLTAAPSSGPPPLPKNIKIKSISEWQYYFNYNYGVFRAPANQGAEVEDLDIDIAYVEAQTPGAAKEPLFLPKVTVLKLRGGDMIDDDDERMDYLAEVLEAVKPNEFHWLSDEAGGGYSPTAHLVHPAVIEAGERWSEKGMLGKLVLRGGFPSSTCPDTTLMNPNKALDFAFRKWSIEEICWDLDSFTPTASVTIVQHYLQAVNTEYWKGACKRVPTRALIFSSVPKEALERIRNLPTKIGLAEPAVEWLQDVLFVGNGQSVSRIWGDHPPVDERLYARLRAELLVLQDRRIMPMAMLWA